MTVSWGYFACFSSTDEFLWSKNFGVTASVYGAIVSDLLEREVLRLIFILGPGDASSQTFSDPLLSELSLLS